VCAAFVVIVIPSVNHEVADAIARALQIYFDSDKLLAHEPGLASFPVALQEQLGLRLEASRDPIDVLVIDSVQQPSEN